MSAVGDISPVEAVSLLRRVRDAAERGEALDRDTASWLVESIDAYLEHASDRGMRLDEAAGLVARKGAAPWWKVEQLRKRDSELKAAAELLAPGMQTGEQAKRLLTEMRAYRRSAWRHHRDAESLPAQLEGTARAHLWTAQHAAPVPDSERQLRRLLV